MYLPHLYRHICSVPLGQVCEGNRAEEEVFMLLSQSHLWDPQISSFSLFSFLPVKFCLITDEYFQVLTFTYSIHKTTFVSCKKQGGDYISHIIENAIVHHTHENPNQLSVICLWSSHQCLVEAFH